MTVDNPRKYKRASMMNSAELMLPGDQSATEVLVVNVSHGGLGMYIPKPLAEGTETILRILYSEGKSERVAESVSGTVRWCRPMGTWFGVGIEFKYLSPREHAMLLKFLEQTPAP
jgi:hypothetical protein